MARSRQQVSWVSTVVNEQTHEGRQSTIDEVEEQARHLSNVKQNIDTMRAAVEHVETIMMHIAQGLWWTDTWQW